MRSILIATLLLLLTFQIANAQTEPSYDAVDSIALEMPDSMTYTTDGIARYIAARFKTDDEKVRALFFWITNSITYDVARLESPSFLSAPPTKTPRTLATRKGVCANFADIFTEVCTLLHIKNYGVIGYIKQRGVVMPIAHEWCIAMIDGTWHFYDPTLASGYIQEHRFVKKFDNTFYDILPTTLIRSHMPFDPMWQLLDHKVTYDQFSSAAKPDSLVGAASITYSDSIAAWEKQTSKEQMIAEEHRIMANGTVNSMTQVRLTLIRTELSNIKLLADNKKLNDNTDIYNAAITNYNKAVKFYNLYIDYLNRSFTPTKSDEKIQAMLDSAEVPILSAQAGLAQTRVTESVTTSMLKTIKTSVDESVKDIAEQKKFLATYFTKNAAERKEMFMR